MTPADRPRELAPSAPLRAIADEALAIAQKAIQRARQGDDAAGPDGRTALMYAAMFDRVEVVEALLRRGACPDLVAGDGSTALQCAQAMGAVRAAARLNGPA
jgi:hypothetical protein